MTVRKKNTILCIIIIAAFIIVIISVFVSADAKSISAATDADRTAFIKTLGLTCREEPLSVRNVIIPAEFGEVYGAYNELQLSAGFDLSPYKGEDAIVYTYAVTNYPDPDGGFYSDIRANLIVIGEKIVGGDISSAALDGFMTGLCPPKS